MKRSWAEGCHQQPPTQTEPHLFREQLFGIAPFRKKWRGGYMYVCVCICIYIVCIHEHTCEFVHLCMKYPWKDPVICSPWLPLREQSSPETVSRRDRIGCCKKWPQNTRLKQESISSVSHTRAGIMVTKCQEPRLLLFCCSAILIVLPFSGTPTTAPAIAFQTVRRGKICLLDAEQATSAHLPLTSTQSLGYT